MTKKSKIITAFVLLCAVLTVCVSADGTYTTKDDPLVSLSYVNDVLTPEIIQSVMDKVNAEYVKLSDVGTVNGGEYTPLILKKGQTVMAKNCCEVILLEGNATVIVTSAQNINNGAGISDLTSGTVVTNGSTVPSNHYLVIPKGDGRGFAVTSDNTSVLVRGEYNIAG